MIKYLLLLIGLVASPAMAQNMVGIWKGSHDRIEAPPANVSFPRSVGGLTLNKTGEASNPGTSLDNTAEFHSADGSIWGTIYVYRPGYPDAALAAYMTDRAIREVYGSGLKRLSQTIVAIGGQPRSAIRITYSGGVLKDSGPLASAAAFTRVNGWILVFRVSGPVGRQSEVETALDAMLTSAKFGRNAYVLPGAPLDFAEPCPPAPSGKVEALVEKDSGIDVLMAAFGASVSNERPREKNDTIAPDFPANGLTKVCVRGTLHENGLEILQPAGTSNPDVILLPLNDSDDVFVVRKNLIGEGYTLSKAEIGRVTVFGKVDRMPDNDALGQITRGERRELLAVRSSTRFQANGKTNVDITTGTLTK